MQLPDLVEVEHEGEDARFEPARLDLVVPVPAGVQAQPLPEAGRVEPLHNALLQERQILPVEVQVGRREPVQGQHRLDPPALSAERPVELSFLQQVHDGGQRNGLVVLGRERAGLCWVASMVHPDDVERRVEARRAR